MDYVRFIIDALDANWDTNNFDPAPIVVDRDDTQQYDTAEAGNAEVGDSVGLAKTVRELDVDLTDNNAVSVGSISTDRTPIGTEFDHRIEATVSVRVEGVHESEFGHITDTQDFQALLSEVRRTILLEREFPSPEDGIHTLDVVDEDDRSREYADYFRTDLTVVFRGYDELP